MAGSTEYQISKRVPASSSGHSDEGLSDDRPSSVAASVAPAGSDSPAVRGDGNGSGGGPWGESRTVVSPRPARRPIPPKLYRIGEVAAYAGTSRQTIHNYTTMGLLQESRWSEGGHRLYDETVFPRLDEILSMKAGRSTLKDIRERFMGPEAPQEHSGVPASDASASGPPFAMGAPPAGRE